MNDEEKKKKKSPVWHSHKNVSNLNKIPVVWLMETSILHRACLVVSAARSRQMFLSAHLSEAVICLGVGDDGLNCNDGLIDLGL